MIDYKHYSRYHYAKSSRKLLPVKKTALKKGGGPALNYQMKFYLVILTMFTCCYFYITYQIENDKTSIFYELHQILTKRFSKKTNEKKITVKPKDQKVSVEKQRPASDREWPINRSASRMYKEEIFIIHRKGDKAFLVPIPVSFKSRREKYFFHLVEKSIHFKPRERKYINAFQKEVKLRNTSIENDVLMIDFNRGFEYSRYGYLGLNAQIQQILWTVLHSRGARDEKISSVAFTIDGKRKRKIGGEGMELKLFYTKKDLRKKIGTKNGEI